MRNFLVMGAGKMGIVLAKDLVDSDSKNKVTLVDISPTQLNKAEKFIKSERLFLLQRNIEDEKQRETIFEGQDVAISALLHKHSLLVLEEAVRRGIHLVDLVGEKPLDRLKYNDKAKEKGIIVISGCGVAPGIANICVGRGVYLLDETEKAIIYVGGNPLHPKPPLNYSILFAIESLLNFYERKTSILKKGKIRKIEPLSGVELIQFPAPFSKMECFYTNGLSSLLYTMKGKIKDELAEKTIRYPGHVQSIKILKACGLFSRKPIYINNQQIIPREVLKVLLESKLKLGKEGDVTLMRVVVSGKKAGKPVTHIFEMIDYYDKKKGYTSMAKTTCYPASIIAQMIVSGKISQRGILFPENIFHSELYNPFMNALKSKGVNIIHKVIFKNRKS
ncbi:saccharopine dehydrogenase NADP-binding domain-containing protein [Candidatus Aminicenantes bacterium AH-873-B07]|jgi:lysine 6-dehydrogenase|nr:saccharopine dehydrogenase NADP-binding domain-containing protein [Candidatus Aminicenantes bacterium AH-873-B07]